MVKTGLDVAELVVAAVRRVVRLAKDTTLLLDREVRGLQEAAAAAGEQHDVKLADAEDDAREEDDTAVVDMPQA